MEVPGLGALPMDTNGDEAAPHGSALLGDPHCPVPCGNSRRAAESAPFWNVLQTHTGGSGPGKRILQSCVKWRSSDLLICPKDDTFLEQKYQNKLCCSRLPHQGLPPGPVLGAIPALSQPWRSHSIHSQPSQLEQGAAAQAEGTENLSKSWGP